MIFIVAGMHRSGTSAMAGSLHENGICMGGQGEFFPPPQKENPKGFFENKRFRTINDQILRSNGYNVKSFSPDMPEEIKPCPTVPEQMRNLFEEYCGRGYKHWGWKDPRTALTIGIWYDALLNFGFKPVEIGIIIMERRRQAIADSMRRRGNKEKWEGQFEALSDAYYNKLYKSLLSVPMETIYYVDFDMMMKSPQSLLAAIGSYFHLDIRKFDFIEPRLSKGKAA